jgi:two-component system, OmpR family, phosphate regulon response regulator PhoB
VDRPTVLVVEDDAGLRLALEHGLAAEGFEVAVASDTASACERAAGARPDVVLLDWGLPDGDGRSACHRVREAHPAARIVMLTGRADGGDAAREAGAEAFLVKGIALDALAGELRRVLEQ